jgi:hypothetical protein
MYGIQALLNYSIAPTQLGLLDGISLWQNNQPTTGSTAQVRKKLGQLQPFIAVFR